MGTGSSYVARRRYRMGRHLLQFVGVVAMIAFIRSNQGAQPTYEDRGTVAKMLDSLPQLSVRIFLPCVSNKRTNISNLSYLQSTDTTGRRASVDSPFSLRRVFGSPFRTVEEDKEAIEQRVEFHKIGTPNANNSAVINVENEPVGGVEAGEQPITDARLAGLESRTENIESSPELVVPSASDAVLLIDQKDSAGSPVTPTDSALDENILVVIISNRRDGIIPTIASILTTASKKVDVVLIGEHKINEQVGAHFGDRINEFTSLSVQDITDDLVAQGLNPIWTWPEWHTSVDNPSWRNENTIVSTSRRIGDVSHFHSLRSTLDCGMISGHILTS